jgi:transcriptional regulator with XRE-family HTH domain
MDRRHRGPRTVSTRALDEPPAAPDDFCSNLRLACSFHPSIAEVCRSLGVNRAQFNKYLSGATRPSAHMLQRLCDFFGVEPHEIVLPQHRFAQLLSVKPARSTPLPAPAYAAHLERLQRQSRDGLDKYLGHYFEYYYSMAFPGWVLRSLFYLYRHQDAVYYRRIERLSQIGRRASGYRCRYLGVALHLNERIFLLDYESLTRNEMTETILYPTYKSRVNYLTGLKIGVSAADRREPACARVVLEALGPRIDLRAVLRQCGLLRPHDDSIASDVLSRIDNARPAGDSHFVGLPF